MSREMLSVHTCRCCTQRDFVVVLEAPKTWKYKNTTVKICANIINQSPEPENTFNIVLLQYYGLYKVWVITQGIKQHNTWIRK